MRQVKVLVLFANILAHCYAFFESLIPCQLRFVICHGLALAHLLFFLEVLLELLLRISIVFADNILVDGVHLDLVTRFEQQEWVEHLASNHH